MPIYEYYCRKCDSKFELLRPISESDKAVSCPMCHASAGRVPSTFACYAKDASGSSSAVGGGSSCGGCSSSSCTTCHS